MFHVKHIKGDIQMNEAKTLVIRGNLVDIINRRTFGAEISILNGHIGKVIPTGQDEGSYLLPGFIDAHTHFDLDVCGTTTADDFAFGSRAALRGGPRAHAFFSPRAAAPPATRLASEGAHPDVIVVDPPRKGCDNATLTAIVQMAPRTLVMVSCNPSTAARDAKFLCEQGYTLEKVQPVDLFPRTRHVECVLQMTCKSN